MCLNGLRIYNTIRNLYIDVHFSILPEVVIANVLSICDIVVSSNSSRAITFTYNLIHVEKAMNSRIPKLIAKYFHYCSSTIIDLALNK